MLGENEKQEIIIVRRGGGGEEGHHGGAWKIAFADFMTAMMALFLVLWLVNATDDKAQKSIASYFNPVKLVDSKKSEKGLSPADNTVEETELEHEAKGETEAEFFGNPAAVLDEIVAEDAIAAPLNEQLGAGTGSPSDVENDYVAEPVFIDPFSQTYWDEQGDELTEPETAEAESLREIIKEQLQEGETVEAADKVSEQIETPEAELEMAQADIEPAVKSEVTEEPIEAAVETPDVQIEEAAKPTEAEELAARVEETLEDVLNVIGLNKDQVRVVAQSEGVLVSLSDDLGFSMFGVGSAIPKAELINAVDAIGAQIADKNVSLSVIGHTDGRPYRGKAYDNWRLSAARAQATLYMLVRSGVDEKRIVSVSGKADRDLKNMEDPFAPENRRIDIMIALDSQ